MIARRRLLCATAGVVVSAAGPSLAQPSRTSAVVGVIMPTRNHPHYETLRKALEDLGNKGGRSIRIEWGFWEGQPERLPKIVDDLMRSRPDVILTSTVLPTRAAMRATTTIPIVFFAVGFDPIAMGLVSNLARPTGNVTGLVNITNDLGARHLQLLTEALPKDSRIGVLCNPTNAVRDYFSSLEEAAKTLATRIVRSDARRVEELEPAFAALASEPVQGLIIQPDSFFFPERTRIATLALKNRMAIMTAFVENLEDGGFIAYGQNLAEQYRRAVYYAGRILKGAKPSELPVEIPTMVQLTINMKTAKLLGLNVPRSVLVRADRVIE